MIIDFGGRKSLRNLYNDKEESIKEGNRDYEEKR